MTLIGNSIYIFLYPMAHAGPDKYHWGIIARTSDYPEGMLLHVYNQSDKWHFEAKPSFEASGVPALCLKIGSVSETKSWVDLRNIVTRVLLNWPLGFSCRTWVKDAVLELQNDGILACSDVEALEQEAKQLAAIYRQGVENGDGVCGYHISAVSK